MDAGFRIEDRMAKALVVIDVQKGMFDPDYPPYDGEAVVDRIAGLIARARAAKAPVFFVQHHGDGDHPFQPGKPGYPFHDKLAPQPGDDVTVKRKSSAFHDTDFDAKLKRAGVKHLIITGMQSEYCVTSAIRGAYERGYGITLVSDAHATSDTRVAKGKDIVAIVNDTTQGSFGGAIPAAKISF
jgi:nicotinamidase-related amidase